MHSRSTETRPAYAYVVHVDRDSSQAIRWHTLYHFNFTEERARSRGTATRKLGPEVRREMICKREPATHEELTRDGIKLPSRLQYLYTDRTSTTLHYIYIYDVMHAKDICISHNILYYMASTIKVLSCIDARHSVGYPLYTKLSTLLYICVKLNSSRFKLSAKRDRPNDTTSMKPQDFSSRCAIPPPGDDPEGPLTLIQRSPRYTSEQKKTPR